ncbi:hypothetical protein BDV95DRAFT_573600 [Massariosphaeria phaeospora]|uniref:Uncharacterized protein n=1 Tax=Massariosphaeria phaeospora TaxID=100035 RepID=A0A7C8MBG3_9PLEO|nr:hypothetical protein BDV95DRAFT_573600 [Massariosphaeria phaeospora]
MRAIRTLTPVHFRPSSEVLQLPRVIPQHVNILPHNHAAISTPTVTLTQIALRTSLTPTCLPLPSSVRVLPVTQPLCVRNSCTQTTGPPKHWFEICVILANGINMFRRLRTSLDPTPDCRIYLRYTLNVRSERSVPCSNDEASVITLLCSIPPTACPSRHGRY